MLGTIKAGFEKTEERATRVVSFTVSGQGAQPEVEAGRLGVAATAQTPLGVADFGLEPVEAAPTLAVVYLDQQVEHLAGHGGFRGSEEAPDMIHHKYPPIDYDGNIIYENTQQATTSYVLTEIL